MVTGPIPESQIAFRVNNEAFMMTREDFLRLVGNHYNSLRNQCSLFGVQPDAAHFPYTTCELSCTYCLEDRDAKVKKPNPIRFIRLFGPSEYVPEYNCNYFSQRSIEMAVEFLDRQTGMIIRAVEHPCAHNDAAVSVIIDKEYEFCKQRRIKSFDFFPIEAFESGRTDPRRHAIYIPEKCERKPGIMQKILHGAKGITGHFF